ncbi:MAG: hypothetical protein ABIQ66_02770 [Novosphingobium sp.]
MDDDDTGHADLANVLDMDVDERGAKLVYAAICAKCSDDGQFSEVSAGWVSDVTISSASGARPAAAINA